MALADIVTISISTESAAVTQAGFGTPLIMAYDCPGGFTERIRTYTDLAGLSADGFSTTGATYQMAAKVFSQRPRVTRLKVGRCLSVPTQRFAITPVVANSTAYTLTINGQTVTFTSDASATMAEIIAGLKGLIDALALPVTVSDQTTYMRILANTAGAFHSISVADISKLGIAQDHGDPGVLVDLAQISDIDDDYYAILHPMPSAGIVTQVGAYAEATPKIFITQTQESAVVLLSSGSDTSSVAYLARALARTVLIYSENGANFADAAFAGKCLPLDPGSETWKFKTLASVPASSLSVTRKDNALAKNVNTYSVTAGVAITEDGKVVAGEYVDVVRFRDWLEARMAESIFGALARAKKIPFTDSGISMIEGLVRAALQAGVDVGGLAASPAFTVSVPKAVDVPANDKAARRLTNVKFDAVLAGAIHGTTISGSITV